MRARGLFFLGHAGFYTHFIKDFSKVALPLSNLLQKEVEFDFDDQCKEAFDCLKRAVTTTPIIQVPDWTAPFELMCDTSNYALGVVLAQKIDKLPQVIYYASRTLDAAQANYTTTDKSFKINGHRLKPFLTNPSLVDVVVEETSLLHPTSFSP